ncbi:MAG TPA: hypothetical protein PKX92_02835 [Edaphocola sp.]|nr:hypothetical protein [Edaphocola sp.]
MKRKHILILILSSLVIKVLYVFIVLAFSKSNSIEQLSFLEVFFRNDSGWYRSVAEDGYDIIKNIDDLGKIYPDYWKQSNWAFFPAYPLSIKLLMSVFSISYLQSAFVFSLITSTACFIAFYKFTLIFLKDVDKAFWIALLFIVSPFHYHYSMFYTEAMFLLMLLLAFIGIAEKKLWVSVLATSVLVLVRPNGLVCLLPIWLYGLEQSGFSFKSIQWVSLIKRSLFLLPAVLVFGGFLLYQHFETGYFNAFSIAQTGWGKKTTFPLLSLFRNGDFTNTFNSIYVCLTILFAIYTIKKLPLSLNVFIWLNLLLPLTAGSVISMTRYITVLFPLFILIAAMGLKLPKSKYYLYAVCLGLQLYLLQYWAVSHSFSY